MEAKRIPRRIKKWQKKYAWAGFDEMPRKFSWFCLWTRRKPDRGERKISKICRKWHRRIRNEDFFTKQYPIDR